MRIVDARRGIIPIGSSIRDTWVDFREMDRTIVAVAGDLGRRGSASDGVCLHLEFEEKSDLYKAFQESD